jgi:hypothetical protein
VASRSSAAGDSARLRGRQRSRAGIGPEPAEAIVDGGSAAVMGSWPRSASAGLLHPYRDRELPIARACSWSLSRNALRSG